MSAALTTDVDKRLLRTTKFPPEFSKKVDTTKVKREVITTWAAGELKRILGDVDEILSGLVSGFIEDNRFPNIKAFQISLTGFLDKETPDFCQHLWNLLLSAQESETGVPKELLEAKKTELINERLEEERQRKEAQKKQDAEREHERNMARIRERERGHPNRRGRGGRDRRDRPPRRDSRSPPPRRGRNDDDSYRRGTDSYVPRGRRQRHRSPSTSRSRSRDQSLPRRRRRSTPDRSRSPSRRRRYSSSPSRERGGNKWERRDSDRHRARSPVDRRVRSRSPRRHRHHRRRSVSSGSRSPPRRNRRPSPSPPSRSASRDRPAEARSSSPPSQKNARRKSRNDDLIQRPSHDGSRLSRQPSQSETTTNDELKRRGSEPHDQPAKRPRNTSSVGIEDKSPTNSGAEYKEESGFSFLNAAARDPNRWVRFDMPGASFEWQLGHRPPHSGRITTFRGPAPASPRNFAVPKPRELFPEHRGGTIRGDTQPHRLGFESHQAANQQPRAVLLSHGAPMNRFMPSVVPPTAPALSPTPAFPYNQEQPLSEREMQEKKKKFITQRNSGWYPSLNKRKDSFNEAGK